MIKIIAYVFCLTFCLTTTINSANVLSGFSTCSAAPADKRKVIKTEELPQNVKDAISSELKDGWKITKVEEIKMAGFADKPEMATQYQVYLKKGKETKSSTFYSDGTISK